MPRSFARRVLSRRSILARGFGMAAAGAIGGSVLAEAVAAPASAAELTGNTVIEQGAVAPTVVFLTDAPVIAVDASLGDDFRVTIAGNRTMGTPASPANGQQILFQITQGPGGGYTITWDSGYEFSSGLPQPGLSSNPGQTDLLGFIYNAAKDNWLLAAFVNGFG